MKFRKKPIIIEAFQMTPERRASNADWPLWMHEAWNAEVLTPRVPDATLDDRLIVRTREGAMLVEWGDWIIQGVHGELYPCKPDIFAATYEVVDDASHT